MGGKTVKDILPRRTTKNQHPAWLRIFSSYSIVRVDGIGGKLSPIEAKCIVECREGLYSPGSRCLNPNLDFLNSLYVGYKDCTRGSEIGI